MVTGGMGPIVLTHTHPLPLDLNILTKSYKTRKHVKQLLGHFHLNILPHVLKCITAKTGHNNLPYSSIFIDYVLPYSLLQFASSC